jgi:hypothetical protein
MKTYMNMDVSMDTHADIYMGDTDMDMDMNTRLGHGHGHILDMDIPWSRIHFQRFGCCISDIDKNVDPKPDSILSIQYCRFRYLAQSKIVHHGYMTRGPPTNTYM